MTNLQDFILHFFIFFTKLEELCGFLWNYAKKMLINFDCMIVMKGGINDESRKSTSRSRSSK